MVTVYSCSALAYPCRGGVWGALAFFQNCVKPFPRKPSPPCRLPPPHPQLACALAVPFPSMRFLGEIAISWDQCLNGLMGSERYLVLVRTLKSLALFVYLDDFQRLLLYFTIYFQKICFHFKEKFKRLWWRGSWLSILSLMRMECVLKTSNSGTKIWRQDNSVDIIYLLVSVFLIIIYTLFLG